ncbi:MAG TPA: DNA repair protein RecN [Thermodesulfobacteriota bacterium]|nr:DNA repair protein RecN [Thermodesulfobacteriota bacterium]
MLELLQIQNLALIENLNIAFGPGLNVLSGETGAGKSIIIKAVNLLLGNKAPAEVIRQGTEEANVSALFLLEARGAREAGPPRPEFSGESQLLLRRSIQGAGKSRAWINGQIVALNQLAQQTRTLISISNQHEYQTLLNPNRHLSFLDRFADLEDLRQQVKEGYEELERQVRLLEKLQEEARQRNDLVELWNFQIREIRQAQLKPGEEQELRRRKEVMRQAEKIWEKIHQAQEFLDGSDQSLSNLLGRVKELVRSAALIDPTLEPSRQALDSLGAELSEIGIELRRYGQGLFFDPRTLEEVEDRLQQFQRLAAKYGPTAEAILEYSAALEGQLKELEDGSQRRNTLEQAVENRRRTLFEISESLSARRRESAGRLIRLVEEEFKELGLSGCRFEIQFTLPSFDPKTESVFAYRDRLLTPEGLERGEFLLAPNPGEGLRPLARIASGGELSRILLVLKGLLSRGEGTETLIFDEVDAGIGGSLGEKVGRKLKQLARIHQVLCITHLPQIAAFADSHYQVIKKIKAKRTFTEIKALNEEERLLELARMLSGTSPSEPTKILAGELLRKSREPSDR